LPPRNAEHIGEKQNPDNGVGGEEKFEVIHFPDPILGFSKIQSG